MIKDYLIIAYMTVLVCWPVTLTLLGGLVVFLLYRKRWLMGGLVLLLWGLTAVSAWQFAYYM